MRSARPGPAAPAAPGRLVVMGAGAIGGYVGGLLQAAGAQVAFVGRARIGEVLRQRGLTLTDLEGRRTVLAPAAIEWLESPPAEPASLTLLTVKSGATAAAARRLAPGSVVLSLQNGVDNVRIAAAAAPALEWLAGVVGWNVAELAPGHLHRGTDGVLAAEDHPVLRAWLPLFAAAGLPLRLHADLRALQWGKLLLNLNNPVNALSGLPLAAELRDRDCRVVLAALQQEALAVLAGAGIAVERLSPLPPRAMLAVLRWPTWAFRLVAARTLRIDGDARSSMADDMARGRATEIDALCGAIVRLAERQGRTAPLNSRLQALVERDPRPRDGRTLRRELGV